MMLLIYLLFYAFTSQSEIQLFNDLSSCGLYYTETNIILGWISPGEVWKVVTQLIAAFKYQVNPLLCPDIKNSQKPSPHGFPISSELALHGKVCCGRMSPHIKRLGEC